jgi:hypothetical protein
VLGADLVVGWAVVGAALAAGFTAVGSGLEAEAFCAVGPLLVAFLNKKQYMNKTQAHRAGTRAQPLNDQSTIHEQNPNS